MRDLCLPLRTGPDPRTVLLRLAVLLGTVWLWGLGLWAADAGPNRASTNYTITTDVLDAGGHFTTSASYANLGSVGGVAGSSQSTAPAEIAKQGYIGQLYEVTGVSVSTIPTTLNEGALRQLQAIATLDDATFLLVAGSAAVWRVVSGPILSISSNGVATAGVVYQDTPAVVRADYQQHSGLLSLTVLDTEPDNYGSYAGDGLSDAWQLQYFGPNNTNAAPGADPDHDGQNNLLEYVVGTVPTNAASRFSLTIADLPSQPGEKRLTLAPRLPDRTYALEFAPNLMPGSFLALAKVLQEDAGSVRTITDTNATQAVRFYRVKISLP
jgi:hypothetical protein